MPVSLPGRTNSNDDAFSFFGVNAFRGPNQRRKITIKP
jgi:hypothetical protein